tara:strand:- start:2060 stop:2488 length:429 start_codon:yes stop_codon:yes gene_type:complete
MIPRPDLIFSYWIFAWFILYKLFKLPINSPKLVISLGILYNFYLLWKMYINDMDYYYLFSFFMTIVILKIIPLYVLRNEKIQKKHIYTSLIVFGIFLIYITSYFGSINKIFNAYYKGENNIVSGNVSSAKNPLMMLFMNYKK